MIAVLRSAWERFRGSGEHAVTVPPMDGALRPNRRIEEAPVALAIEAPDNLVLSGRVILFSSGSRVLALDPELKSATDVHAFEGNVAALAGTSDGTLAVALEDGRILIRGGAHDGKSFSSVGGRPLTCPTALLFAADSRLLVAQGSSRHAARAWKRDVMERGRTGSVWHIDLGSGDALCIADRLSFPYGLALADVGAVAIAESWRSRIVLAGHNGTAPQTVLDELPGYPARLSPCDEGYWLSIFAPRNQLIEFVQREPEFRRRMMADIDPEYWAAPSLRPSQTFLEPLQGGAQKHLGMLKPWAPTRSYGLVVRLDGRFRPIESFHSRADGRRHGVTSCIQVGTQVLIASKGGDVIVAVQTGEDA